MAAKACSTSEPTLRLFEEVARALLAWDAAPRGLAATSLPTSPPLPGVSGELTRHSLPGMQHPGDWRQNDSQPLHHCLASVESSPDIACLECSTQGTGGSIVFNLSTIAWNAALTGLAAQLITTLLQCWASVKMLLRLSMSQVHLLGKVKQAYPAAIHHDHAGRLQADSIRISRRKLRQEANGIQAAWCSSDRPSSIPEQRQEYRASVSVNQRMLPVVLEIHSELEGFAASPG